MRSEEDEDKVKTMDDGGSDDKPKGVTKHSQSVWTPQIFTVFYGEDVPAEAEMVLDSPTYNRSKVTHHCKFRRSIEYFSGKACLQFQYASNLELNLRPKLFQT